MRTKRIQFKEFSDEELFFEVKLDNHHAFEELYRRYFYRILNDAFKRLRDRDQSEELIQELFVNIWLKRHQIMVAKTFDAYLHTSLRNAVISFFRKNDKVAEYPANYTEQEDKQATYEEIAYNDLKTAYDQSISDLPEKCRIAYELFESGMSIQEIANTTNVSPKTIESHLLKARNTIRQQLRDFSAASSFTFMISLLEQTFDLI
ncbi:RNA polymerase sigma factor [Dyadobacter frigoris]|uniref:Sigma-70 family RNA polymerase sigma factor n=1 Tax=Dyadobacter frigoris TaxID=2576211 RepID=A0A4U6D0R7_9BACT|nr:sigma-70 family RNA polymerase sigma factor [Dyadobacter frigoris]TKT89727.1 sigma-70 family RNA polymerase sigma factor [Dyadobacter frigoris]GLU54044.1 RNA polymerase sigma-70 factor [Dyadobacter frigoris]